MSALELREVIARVVWITESVELGEIGAALTALRDLEADLASGIAQLEERA